MRLIKERSFYKHLLLLALPIFLQQLLRISVDTLNSLMLGSIDQTQMSAISQANQVFFVYYTLCCGMSVGCSVLVSQFWGKKDTESIPLIISHALRTMALLGLFFSLLVYLYPELFMRIYSSDAGIIETGAAYLRKVSLMYAVCGLSVVMFGAARGLEQVKIIFRTNLISYSINIFFDYVLLFGKFGFPEMGVDGIALGTIIARYAEFLICAAYFIRSESIPFTLTDIRKTERKIRRALYKVTAPILVHELVWSLGTSSGAMIAGQLGRDVVAGYNVTTILYDLCASVGNGLGSACSVVIGMTLGQGDRERAVREADSMLVIAGICGIILGLFSMAVRDIFIGFYDLNSEAVSYARQFISLIALIWPFSMLEIVGMIAILRAGGEGRVGFFTDLVVMWMICIPLASYLAFFLKAAPWIVIASIKLIIVLESIIGIISVYKYRWLRNLTDI